MFDLGLGIGYLDGLIRGYFSTEVKTPKGEPKTAICSADLINGSLPSLPHTSNTAWC
jgi:hypothetical protein